MYQGSRRKDSLTARTFTGAGEVMDWLPELGDFVQKVGFPVAVAIFLLFVHTRMMRTIAKKIDTVILLLQGIQLAQKATKERYSESADANSESSD